MKNSSVEVLQEFLDQDGIDIPAFVDILNEEIVELFETGSVSIYGGNFTLQLSVIQHTNEVNDPQEICTESL